MKLNKLINTGFTLIELMVTLTIASILLLVAAPSLTAFKRNSELTSLSNTLLSAMNAARGEAMKRNMAAYVTPTDGGASWDNGWIVFVDKNNNQVFDDESTDLLVMTQSAPAGYFSITGKKSAGETPAYIRFDGSGYPKLKDGGNGALSLTVKRNDLTATALYENTRHLMIDTVGRVRICKPKSASDTDCKPSN